MPRIRPLIFTCFNSAAMFVVGMVTAQKGPSFNDLILISSTDVEGGSFFVTASNFGYMLGSVLAGTLYGRVKSKSLIIALALAVSGAFTALTPWCSMFTAMLIVSGATSIFSSIYETTITTEEVQAWDGNSESAMQFMSFCYSFGGVIGPLITEPFMAPKSAHIPDNNNSSVQRLGTNSSELGNEINVSLNHSLDTSIARHNNPCGVKGSDCSEYLYSESSVLYNLSRSNISHLQNDTSMTSKAESRLHYAYLITGCLSVAMATVFCLAFLKFRSSKRKQDKISETSLPRCRKLPRKLYIGLLTMASLYYYFHTMGIDSFGQYLFFFVVTHLDWSKEHGAYIVSLYWALAMFVKLCLVIIYKRVHLGIVLVFSVIGITIAMALFTLAGQLHVHELVWISTAIMAMSQASIFGGGFSWIDANLICLGGKSTSALMISGGLGALSAPLPLGFLMKELSLMAFPFFVLFQLSVSASIFLAMIFIFKPFINKIYGPLRSSQIPENVSAEEAGEIMVRSECIDERADDYLKTSGTVELNSI